MFFSAHWTIESFCEQQGLSLSTSNYLLSNSIGTTNDLVSFLENKTTGSDDPFFVDIIESELCFLREQFEFIKSHGDSDQNSNTIGLLNSLSLFQLKTVYLSFLEQCQLLGLKLITKENELEISFYTSPNTKDFIKAILNILEDLSSKERLKSNGLSFSTSGVLKKLIAHYIVFLKSAPAKIQTQEYISVVLRNIFPQEEEIAKDLILNFITSEGKVQIFRLLKELLDREILLKSEKLRIFKEIYTEDRSFSGPPKSRNEKSDQMEDLLTRSFFIDFNIIQFFSYYRATNYNIYHNRPCFAITQQDIEGINKEEGTNFSFSFFTRVFDLLLFEAYQGFNDHHKQFLKYELQFYIKSTLAATVDFDKINQNIEGLIRLSPHQHPKVIISDYIKHHLSIEYQHYDEEIIQVVQMIVSGKDYSK